MRCLFDLQDPGWGVKKSGSGSGMKNPHHISECSETFFLGLKFFNSLRDGVNSDPGWKKLGSWIRDGENRIRDGKNRIRDPD
jgi:hypothetical protein